MGSGAKKRAAKNIANSLTEGQIKASEIQIDSINNQLDVISETLRNAGIQESEALSAAINTLTATSQEKQAIIENTLREAGLDEQSVLDQTNNILTTSNQEQFDIVSQGLRDLGVAENDVINLAESISIGGLEAVNQIATAAERGATATELRGIADVQRTQAERGLAGIQAREAGLAGEAQAGIEGIQQATQEGVLGAGEISAARQSGVEQARQSLLGGQQQALQAGAPGQQLFTQGSNLLLQAISEPIGNSPFVQEQIRAFNEQTDRQLAAAGLLNSGAALELKADGARKIIAEEAVRRQGLLQQAVNTGQVSAANAQNILQSTSNDLANLGISSGDIQAEEARQTRQIRGESALQIADIESDRQRLQGELNQAKQNLIRDAEVQGITNTAEGQAQLQRQLSSLDTQFQSRLADIQRQAAINRGEVQTGQIQSLTQQRADLTGRQAQAQSGLLSGQFQARQAQRQGISGAQVSGVGERGQLASDLATGLGGIGTGVTRGLGQAQTLAQAARGEVGTARELNLAEIAAGREQAIGQASADRFSGLLSGAATLGGAILGGVSGGPAGSLAGARAGGSIAGGFTGGGSPVQGAPQLRRQRTGALLQS